MPKSIYREGRSKVTEEIKRAVSRLVDQEKDWENKKKHPSRWYRTETARILTLDESNNPSLRSYEELVREIRGNARVQNPVDKPWNTALLNSESLDPDLIPWIINAQHHRKQFLSKPLSVREVKWFTRLFGFRTHFKPSLEIENNPDLRSFFISNVLATWAQIYAEIEKVDDIAGIQEPDYSDLDIAIVDNDSSVIREYSDEKLSDQAHGLLGKRRDLIESQRARIQEEWTLPSLKHNILILESRVLKHSLGDPDMSPQYLRAYHTLLFCRDHGRDETGWGATYQKRVGTFMQLRKDITEESEETINVINSSIPEYNMWWEDLWGTNKRTKLDQNKEGS
ncbi:MAG: hypothetical protein Q8O55_06395 [Dehalococcoidales bacterium]|nr:hypothetical protein [Dehalococcoidales bacterium]